MDFRVFFPVALVLLLGMSLLYAQDDPFKRATASLSDPERNLLEEFRRVFPKIQSLYTNIQMEADLSRYQKEGVQGGGSPVPSGEELPLAGRSHLTFYVRDGLRIDDTLKPYYRLEVADYGSQASLDIPEEEWIGIATPDNIYALSKFKERSYIAGTEKTSDQALSQHIFSVPFLSAPYAISGIPVTRWMFEFDDVTVQSVTPDKSSSDGEIVTVIFRRHYPMGDAHFECRFMRNKGWALLYAKKVVGSPNNHEGGFILQNTYEGEVDGIPLLKRVVYEEFYGETNAVPEIYLRKNYEITKIIPGPPKLAVFDVQRLLSSSSGKWSYFRILCVAIAAALIAAGLYLRFLKNEKRS